QAEDGIRDDLVTGVQTCALPISDRGVVHPRRHPHLVLARLVLGMDLRTPEQVVDVCGVDRDALDLPAGDLARDLAPELPDLTLQPADAGRAGVAGADLHHSGVRERALHR